jgi:hypothetical protein
MRGNGFERSVADILQTLPRPLQTVPNSWKALGFAPVDQDNREAVDDTGHFGPSQSVARFDAVGAVVAARLEQTYTGDRLLSLLGETSDDLRPAEGRLRRTKIAGRSKKNAGAAKASVFKTEVPSSLIRPPLEDLWCSGRKAGPPCGTDPVDYGGPPLPVGLKFRA